MSDPDALSTMPLRPRFGVPSPHDPSEFILLAQRAGESSRSSWERLLLRLSEQG